MTTVDQDKLAAWLKAAPECVLEETVPPEPGPEPPTEPKGPTAFGDAIAVKAGGKATLDLAANDQPGESPIVAATIVTEPLSGGAELAGTMLTYTPGMAYQGPDELAYTVMDQAGLTSNIATVAITVLPAEPVPEPPPSPHVLRLSGLHGAGGLTNGVPNDVVRSLEVLEGALTRKPAQVVGCWPGKDKPTLMLPGRGMPANVYQRITDRGAVALVAWPICWLTKPGAWDDIVSGKHNSYWDAHLEWMVKQGQTKPRLRIVEQGLRGAFPWGVNFSKEKDFSDLREATEYWCRYIRKNLSGAMIIMSHFKHPHTGTSAAPTRWLDPLDYSVRHELYDCVGLDYYDGDTEPYSPANAEKMDNRQQVTAKFKSPWGIRRWYDFAISQDKLFSVDEWGIMCPAGAQPTRDNPFFLEHVHELMTKTFDQQRVAHLAYFKPQKGSNHQLLPTTQVGTRKATDAYIKLYGA